MGFCFSNWTSNCQENGDGRYYWKMYLFSHVYNGPRPVTREENKDMEDLFPPHQSSILSKPLHFWFHLKQRSTNYHEIITNGLPCTFTLFTYNVFQQGIFTHYRYTVLCRHKTPDWGGGYTKCTTHFIHYNNSEWILVTIVNPCWQFF